MPLFALFYMPQKTAMIYPRKEKTRFLLSRSDATVIPASPLSEKSPLRPEQSPFFEKSTLRLEAGELVPTSFKIRFRQRSTIPRSILYDLGADSRVLTDPVSKLSSQTKLTAHFLSNERIPKDGLCIGSKLKYCV